MSDKDTNTEADKAAELTPEQTEGKAVLEKCEEIMKTHGVTWSVVPKIMHTVDVRAVDGTEISEEDLNKAREEISEYVLSTEFALRGKTSYVGALAHDPQVLIVKRSTE